MASRFLLFALCLVAATTIVTGQQQGVFRVDTQTVPLYATVIDKNGRLVPYLDKEHFEVLDDGKPQELTVFRSDVQPVSVVVMLDTSGSMTMNIELLKLAAEQFAMRLLPTDKAMIGSFSENIYSSGVFSSDRDDLIRYIHTEIRFGNPTFLWDAIDYSIDKLMNADTSRRVVLIFTDGDDQKSVKTDFDRVLARAESEGIMVYSIGLRSFFMGMMTRPDQRLKLLSASTGGGYFELERTADLGSTFTRVADELHRQYVLGFKPAVLDGKVHLLDVRMKVEGMTVRARRSYIAKPGGDD